MEKIRLGDAFDLLINFVILSINFVMFFIMLSSNVSFGQTLLLERSINRGLLFGNVVLAALSFFWIYRKRRKLEYMIKENRMKHKKSKKL